MPWPIPGHLDPETLESLSAMFFVLSFLEVFACLFKLRR